VKEINGSFVDCGVLARLAERERRGGGEDMEAQAPGERMSTATGGVVVKCSPCLWQNTVGAQEAEGGEEGSERDGSANGCCRS
jgi:hypothetical protein